MVLMGDGCAEEREDPVARRLHHVTVVTVDRLNHYLERGIDHAPRVLRVEILHQLGRSLDVSEQRGNEFALALRYVVGFRGDACADYRSRYGSRSGRRCRPSGAEHFNAFSALVQSGAACVTEPRARTIGCSAPGTCL